MRSDERGSKPGERGFALVAVLLVLGMLGIIGAEFAYSMRLEAEAMRTWRDNMSAAHLAEAGVEQAIREISGQGAFANVPFDGVLTFYKEDRLPLPRLPRVRARLGAGGFSYRITDEQARINVNTAPPERLDKLLQCLGVDKIVRDQIVDSILDWIDTNDDHRLNGAESEDYYLKQPVPYRARNGPLESVTELLQIKGVTPAIFEGGDGRVGLRDAVTVRGTGRTGSRVNVNTAGPVVLCAMGVADAQISSIMQGRLEAPYNTTPANLANPQFFATTTDTFRIEAEGLVEGRPRATVTAIVQKRDKGPLILEWSGVR